MTPENEALKREQELYCLNGKPKLFQEGFNKGFHEGFISAKADSEQRIAELEQELAVIKDGLEADKALTIALNKVDANTIAELQAHINRLREALEACKYDCNTGEVIGIAREALSFTSAQSLKAHDDAIYEKGYVDGYNVCSDMIDND